MIAAMAMMGAQKAQNEKHMVEDGLMQMAENEQNHLMNQYNKRVANQQARMNQAMKASDTNLANSLSMLKQSGDSVRQAAAA